MSMMPGSQPPDPGSSRPEGAAYPPAAAAPQPLRIPFPTRKPVVAYTLLGICVAVYLLQLATLQWLDYDWPATVGREME